MMFAFSPAEFSNAPPSFFSFFRLLFPYSEKSETFNFFVKNFRPVSKTRNADVYFLIFTIESV